MDGPHVLRIRLECEATRSYDFSDFLEVSPGPSPSQMLGTFSRFSEDFPGRERDPLGGSPRVREDPLGKLGEVRNS